MSHELVLFMMSSLTSIGRDGCRDDRLMPLSCSERRCLLATEREAPHRRTSGSKIGRVTMSRMAGLDEVHDLVTDDTADRDELARIRDVGVAVHVVESADAAWLD